MRDMLSGWSAGKSPDSGVSWLRTLLYWLAVFVISIALVIGLILFLESRDQSSVEGADRPSAITSPS
jgi:hypothetical protein